MQRASCLVLVLALACSRWLPTKPQAETVASAPTQSGADVAGSLADLAGPVDAAAAVPAHSPGYVEAESMLAHIAQSAAAYYRTPHGSFMIGIPIYCQFPMQTAVTPAGPSCCDKSLDADSDGRCDAMPGLWSTSAWSALQYTMLDPHWCQYQFESSGNLDAAKFTASAFCDTDCDGDFATFQMTGKGDPAVTVAMKKYFAESVHCTDVELGPLVVLKDEPAPTKVQEIPLPKLAPPSPARAEAESWLAQISAGAGKYLAIAPKVGKCEFPLPVPATAGGESCCSGQVDADDDDRCDVRPEDWTSATWVALGIAVKEQRYCQYSFDASGAGKTAKFTTTAYCDMDCDGIFATFEQAGWSEACTGKTAPYLFANFENE